MRVKDFFQLEDKDYWLKKIGESDWTAGKYLCEILSKNQFNELYGKTSKVFLLIDGNDLVRLFTRFDLFIMAVQNYVLDDFYDSNE